MVVSKKELRQLEQQMGKLRSAGEDIVKGTKMTNKQELMKLCEEKPEIVDSLLFVVRSGILEKVCSDARKEHWLPDSNVKFRNVSRSFMATALAQMAPSKFTSEICVSLAHTNGEQLEEAFYRGTFLSKNSGVPTRHKHSLLLLLEELHTQHGAPLKKVTITNETDGASIDWGAQGVFELVKDAQAESITGVKHTKTGKQAQSECVWVSVPAVFG